MSESPLLSVRELRKSYAGTTAVETMSFNVNRQEIVGLLGPNGAGKTTTINMILGVLLPSSGTITINGFDMATRRRHALQHANFAAVYAPLPGNLTVEQNLHVFGLLYEVPDLPTRIDELLKQFDLEHFRKTKCGLLSSGEQTRASLAKAMLNRPALLLLDEPTASLDPSTALTIRTQIRRFASESQGAVLWTSHNMYEVEDVCDRVLLMSHGKVVLEGDPKVLPKQYGKATLEELFIAMAQDDATARTL